ncbi:MAG: tetratricopeptide repeat protein [Pyrinomonadaceae bacterium]|nr:tetratricopeptide repeat protein [Pyrinomonadaceae bacterium]
MRIIVATLTILLSFTFAFGQTAKNDEVDPRLLAALTELAKDGGNDFAAIRGKEISRDEKEIVYAVNKNYFAPWFLDTKLRYNKESKVYKLWVSAGSGAVIDKVKSFFENQLLKNNSSFSHDKIGSHSFYFNKRELADISNEFPLYWMIFTPDPDGWKVISDYLSKGDSKSKPESKDKLGLDILSTFDSLKEEFTTQAREKCEHGDEYACNKLIEVHAKKIKANPKDSQAYYYRGIGYRNLPGDLADGTLNKNQLLAVEDFKKCISIDSKFSDCYTTAGETLSASASREHSLQAINYLNKAINLGIESKDIYFYLAESKRNHLGMDEEAIREYTTFLNSKDKDLDLFLKAHYGRGLVYLRTGEYQKAIDDFSEAEPKIFKEDTLHELKDREALYLAKGKAYTKLKKYSDALACLNEALKVFDSSKPAKSDTIRKEILKEIELAKKGGK